MFYSKKYLIFSYCAKIYIQGGKLFYLLCERRKDSGCLVQGGGLQGLARQDGKVKCARQVATIDPAYLYKIHLKI